MRCLFSQVKDAINRCDTNYSGVLSSLKFTQAEYAANHHAIGGTQPLFSTRTQLEKLHSNWVDCSKDASHSRVDEFGAESKDVNESKI